MVKEVDLVYRLDVEFLFNKFFILLTLFQMLIAGICIYQLQWIGYSRGFFLLIFFALLCVQGILGIFLIRKYSKKSWGRLIKEAEKIAQKNLRIMVEE